MVGLLCAAELVLACSGEGSVERDAAGVDATDAGAEDVRVADGAMPLDVGPSDASLADAGQGDADTAGCRLDVDCDDDLACTRDRCAASGECVHVSVDDDGDGHAPVSVGGVDCVGGDDCDDVDPLVHPTSAEVCNAADDDCDGIVDDGLECSGDATRPCVTRCGNPSVRRCSACRWGACEEPLDACDGLDDDCDGTVDEDETCGDRGVCVAASCREADLDCTVQTYGGHHYAVCARRVTWDEARARCEAFGAYLVSVGDADEQEAVVAWLAGRSWLGLTRQGSCEWHWVNG
ncbi:MAG: C-type lectin domain-containing protein, partial [Deltaproteobacteria bacterium]|nr:C-type lectin domain-containing protein [Deltaproteobacteria bacterium]